MWLFVKFTYMYIYIYIYIFICSSVFSPIPICNSSVAAPRLDRESIKRCRDHIYFSMMQLTGEELHERCLMLKLPTSGTKLDLITRIRLAKGLALGPTYCINTASVFRASCSTLPASLWAWADGGSHGLARLWAAVVGVAVVERLAS